MAAAVAPWVRAMMAFGFAGLALAVVSWPMLALAAVVPLGWWAARCPVTKTAAWLEGLAHGLGMFAILGTFFGLVPAFVDVFKEYEVPLPQMTILVVRTSDAAARYFYLAVPLAIAFVMVDVALFSRWHARISSQPCAILWSCLLTVAFFSTVILSALALLVPLFDPRPFHLSG